MDNHWGQQQQTVHQQMHHMIENGGADAALNHGPLWQQQSAGRWLPPVPPPHPSAQLAHAREQTDAAGFNCLRQHTKDLCVPSLPPFPAPSFLQHTHSQPLIPLTHAPPPPPAPRVLYCCVRPAVARGRQCGYRQGLHHLLQGGRHCRVQQEARAQPGERLCWGEAEGRAREGVCCLCWEGREGGLLSCAVGARGGWGRH
jgi:hypothetical protein